MKIFGMSVFTIAIIVAAFIIGARNPGFLDRFPMLKMSS